MSEGSLVMVGCLFTWIVAWGCFPASAAAECPRLAAIQAAAEDFGGLTPPPSWRARARVAALLPEASVRMRTARGWKEGTGASRVAIPEIDHDQSADIRLTWRLDRLVFHSDEPRLAVTARSIGRARVGLRQDVARAYFRWRRLRDRAATDEAAALDAEEAIAVLDAFTGGWLVAQGCR